MSKRKKKRSHLCPNCNCPGVDTLPGIGAPGYSCGSYELAPGYGLVTSVECTERAVLQGFARENSLLLEQLKGRDEKIDELRKERQEDLKIILEQERCIEGLKDEKGQLEEDISELLVEKCLAVQENYDLNRDCRLNRLEIGTLRNLLGLYLGRKQGDHTGVFPQLEDMLFYVDRLRKLSEAGPPYIFVNSFLPVLMSLFEVVDRLSLELSTVGSRVEADEEEGLVA